MGVTQSTKYIIASYITVKEDEDNAVLTAIKAFCILYTTNKMDLILKVHLSHRW